MLVSHVLVPPAMEAILSSPENRVQGFLAAGHVCTVMGYTEYEPIAAKYRVPIVVTGFEPLDILQGVYMCVKQLEEGRAEVENQYARAVRRDGNVPAQQLIREVFQVVPRKWRGIGEIPAERARPAPTPTARSTPSGGSASPITTADEPTECMQRPDPAGPARSRTSARRSARAARPSIRWARRWCRRRAPAPRTTAIGACSCTPVAREAVHSWRIDRSNGFTCPVPIGDAHARAAGARRRRAADATS